jgi:hypothetical protein
VVRSVGVAGPDPTYAGMMPMDFYYTDRFDKYAEDEGIYHVLFSCPKGVAIKEKHRTLGMPSPTANRRPCGACLGEIKDWLRGLPPEIRPSQFREDGEAGEAGEAQEGAEFQEDPGGSVLPE